MQQTISSYDEDVQQAMLQHVEMSQRAAVLTEELEQYKILLGPNMSPDLAELSRLLREKEDEVQKYKLLELQRTEVGKINCKCLVPGLTLLERLRSRSTWNWKRLRVHGKRLIDKSRTRFLTSAHWRKSFQKVKWMCVVRLMSVGEEVQTENFFAESPVR